MTVPEVFELDVPMVIELKTGVRPLTHNDRLHWRAKADRVREIRLAAGFTAKAMRIPKAEHITVQLNYRPAARSVTDAPNLTATSKPAIDGLVDAGVVPNDTDEFVTEVMPVIRKGPGKRRLWMTVEVSR